MNVFQRARFKAHLRQLLLDLRTTVKVPTHPDDRPHPEPAKLGFRAAPSPEPETLKKHSIGLDVINPPMDNLTVDEYDDDFDEFADPALSSAGSINSSPGEPPRRV